MAQYTRLDSQEIDNILTQFDIHSVSSFELLQGGSENTNYVIKSESGTYILCVCEQKTRIKAKNLADLLKYLEANNFNTSKIKYSADKESIIVWKGKPIMLRLFLKGNTHKDLSSHLLKLIGKQLAKLHQIDPPEYLPKKINYGKEQFVNIKKYAAHSEFDLWLDKIIKYMDPYFNLSLPKVFVHGDVFWDNVIISADEKTATIMDFEESACYYRIFDVGMTIIGTCGEGEVINLNKTKSLLQGYASEIKLSKDEINSLKAFVIYAGASMTFWRYHNFNHVKPNPKMVTHYLGLKVLVDHVFKLDDNCFIAMVNNEC